MSDLDRKASDWQGRLVKTIVTFAIVGCVVLVIAVFALGNLIGELTHAIADPTATNASH